MIEIAGIQIGKGAPLAFIVGPCVIEGEEPCLRAAEGLKELFGEQPFIFKSSYDKANRTSLKSYRGPGLEEGLRILERVRNEFELPIYTDVHSPEEARAAGAVCDAIQLPAFLCRQTDLLVAAAQSARAVAVKKGQFMAPWDMAQVVEKLSGHPNVMLIDRGTCFGYNNLVTDLRAIPIMQELGVPVCFDATHSVQLPGGLGTRSGGQIQYAPLLAKAAVVAEADCLFMEAHPQPEQALCDGASMLNFEALKKLLEDAQELSALVRRQAVHV